MPTDFEFLTLTQENIIFFQTISWKLQKIVLVLKISFPLKQWLDEVHICRSIFSNATTNTQNVISWSRTILLICYVIINPLVIKIGVRIARSLLHVIVPCCLFILWEAKWDFEFQGLYFISFLYGVMITLSQTKEESKFWSLYCISFRHVVIIILLQTIWKAEFQGLFFWSFHHLVLYTHCTSTDDTYMYLQLLITQFLTHMFEVGI